ncbi:MAG: hypothetical protein ABSF37_11590 [Sedimentisphaerales bacterium]
MSISSHLGMVILVIIGMATVVGVLIIAMIEARRTDSGKSSILSNAPETTTDKKKN